MQGHAEPTWCLNATGLPLYKQILSRYEYRRGIKCNKIVNVYSVLITPTQLSVGNYLTIFHDSISTSNDVHNKTQFLLLILLLPTEYMDLRIYFIYHVKYSLSHSDPRTDSGPLLYFWTYWPKTSAHKWWGYPYQCHEGIYFGTRLSFQAPAALPISKNPGTVWRLGSPQRNLEVLAVRILAKTTKQVDSGIHCIPRVLRKLQTH